MPRASGTSRSQSAPAWAATRPVATKPIGTAILIVGAVFVTVSTVETDAAAATAGPYQITAASVTSLEGVAIKLRAAVEWNRDEPDDLVIEGVKTALEVVERLVQPTGPDSIVAMWARWVGLRDAPVPDGLEGEAESRWVDEKRDEMAVLELCIVSAQALTRDGSLAQIAFLAYWAEESCPFAIRSAAGQLREGIERTLADIAAGQGGAS